MKNRDFGLLILRLTVGLLMIPHGINKMIHPEAFDFVRGTVEAKDLPLFIAYGVFVGEIHFRSGGDAVARGYLVVQPPSIVHAPLRIHKAVPSAKRAGRGDGGFARVAGFV